MTTTFAPDDMTVRELLSAYAAILDILRSRHIVRSIYNPRSDYAEVLFCQAFGVSVALAPHGAAGSD